MPSEARLIKYISTNPPKRLCKADTERGSIGGEVALITKTYQYLSFGGGFNFRLSNHNVPPGPSANPYGEARRAEFDGTGWTGGRMGRSLKVSFNFVHTFWVFRTCIYILVYEIKVVTNILMGFKI